MPTSTASRFPRCSAPTTTRSSSATSSSRRAHTGCGASPWGTSCPTISPEFGGGPALTLPEVMPRAEIVVVTTPQAAAQRVAQRSAFAARRLKLSVRGVIENMSWFTGDDGTHYELFGSGGGATLAADLGVPLLGQVPLVNAVRLGGGHRHPVT